MTGTKTRGLLAFIVLACALAGCGGGQDKPADNPGAAVQEPSDEPAATINKREAIIYLTDAELLETVEHPVELSYSTDEELVKAAVAELQKDAGENALSLWKPIEIKSVKLDSGQVDLDVHVPDEARLGAPGELLVIETLQKTLFQFDFVQSIELLVDGEAVESLMGHVDLEHPFKKE
ncbi:GerMN domain-containing protein [Paenibacillus arenilitoris]|uniref:GerMN domain-containing protein n=1 Tax=Paenibacillus arenilitoris TaxID=2772299 RepID=A0A927H685_9BACL|nr:GerMN domain-containing protein [Paenibacillus arenilitoris]MBD2869720.1 GerMN domain-containing protein [Paenibacillus arenilitoris]